MRGPAAGRAPAPPTTPAPAASLEFNPPLAGPVLVNSPWAPFAVRVLKSDGSLDSGNNTTQITVSLNSTMTGVLAGTPVTKTVSAGVAEFAVPGDAVISYDKTEAVNLKATTPDIPGYTKYSNTITVLPLFAVSSVSPVENATNVSVTTTVGVTFNRTVNAASVNSASFSLAPYVPGTYTVSGSTATFTPGLPLDLNTTYTATVTTAVTDTRILCDLRVLCGKKNDA